MDEKLIQKLKDIPRTRCTKCDTPSSSRNPMARCWECKKKFCFDHIHGGQVNKKMKINDEIRNICEECKKKHGYSPL